MKTEPIPPSSSAGRDGEASDSNRSIPDLIDELRTAFRSTAYDHVQRVLMAREENLKREIERKNVQLEQTKESLETVRRQKAEAVEELKSFMAKYYGIMEEARARAMAAEERARSAEESAKRSEERYEKLLREVKKTESEKSCDLGGLRREKGELESAKRRAEEELELWKRRFGELEERVARLEADTVEIAKAMVEATPRPTILITDSDDDCAPRASSSENESSPRVLKRKRSSESENEDENVVPDNGAGQDQERVIELGGASGNDDPATVTSASNGAGNQDIPASDGQGVLGPSGSNAAPETSGFSRYGARVFEDEFDGLEVTSSSSDSDSDY